MHFLTINKSTNYIEIHIGIVPVVIVVVTILLHFFW